MLLLRPLSQSTLALVLTFWVSTPVQQLSATLRRHQLEYNKELLLNRQLVQRAGALRLVTNAAHEVVLALGIVGEGHACSLTAAAAAAAAAAAVAAHEAAAAANRSLGAAAAVQQAQPYGYNEDGENRLSPAALAAAADAAVIDAFHRFAAVLLKHLDGQDAAAQATTTNPSRSDDDERQQQQQQNRPEDADDDEQLGSTTRSLARVAAAAGTAAAEQQPSGLGPAATARHPQLPLGARILQLSTDVRSVMGAAMHQLDTSGNLGVFIPPPGSLQPLVLLLSDENVATALQLTPEMARELYTAFTLVSEREAWETLVVASEAVAGWAAC